MIRELLTDAIEIRTFVQQGSSPQFRVRNECRWYVLKEVWQGSHLLNTRLLASYIDRADAEMHLANILDGKGMPHE